MSKPRKHAALIHAWADGAEIQVQVQLRDDKVWVDIDDPRWDSMSKYRVKPVEVEVRTALRQARAAKDMVISEHPIYARPNVKCVFDGVNGELISVEKI